MAGAGPVGSSPHALLEQFFGHREFLSAQEEVITAILSGRDTLVVMPTGGGKSLCYQLPALALDGLTIVVSPLIALMKDQVDALQARGISAELINSTLTPNEQSARIRRMEAGELKLVYVAPERFRSQRFVEALKRTRIALFAVDEAHCISQWGHDFRPDYFLLSHALRKLGHPLTAAYTATATPEVRADIAARLALRDPAEFVSGFARPNLQFVVHHTPNEYEKSMAVRRLIDSHRTGLIYCSTRKHVESVSALLKEWKVGHVSYHGGMADEARDVAQEEFVSGKVDVAVATNAFGMGIDRSDTRFVAHYDIPGSLEAYYQEAGRAGRDGEAAVCELLFSPVDIRVQEFFLEGANPSYTLILGVYEMLRRSAGPDGMVLLTSKEISERLDVGKNDMAVNSALSLLSRIGAIERLDVPGQRSRGTRVVDLNQPASRLEIDPQTLADKEVRDRAKLRAMTRYADSFSCRQKYILEYFGEPNAQGCGTCDRCIAAETSQGRALSEEEFLDVRKALSGVARMCYRGTDGEWVGRFGKARIVQTLLGKRSKVVVDAQHDQLSTFGILKHLDNARLNILFRALHEAGLVEVSTGQYPVLALTESGDKVMHGKSDNLRLVLPDTLTAAPPRKRQPAAKAPPLTIEAEPLYDVELFELLRARRMEFAKEHNLMPVYRVFPDATLKAFARLLPTTEEAAVRINGVSESKAREYFPAFLPILLAAKKGGQ